MDRDSKGKFINEHKNFKIKKNEKCSVFNCKKNVLSRKFCGQHYQRNKKYGNPLEPYKWLGRPNSGKKFKCLNCNKEFYRCPSEVKKGMFKYCSKDCGYIARKGVLLNIPPIEKRNWRINRKGYFETTIRRRRILQHRWIVEDKILKRKLKKEEIIHHLNGIKHDNRIDNLAICTNKTHALDLRV